MMTGSIHFLISRIIQIFNNRELATIIWSIISITLLLSQKSIRKSFRDVLKTFFQKGIFISIVIMIIYVSLLVVAFYHLEMWDITLLKDTIYWTFGVAFILFLNIYKAIEQGHYFKKIILDAFKVVIVIEFLSNLYTFSFIIEFVSLPFLLFFMLMGTFSEGKDEYKSVKIISNSIFVLYGVTVAVFSTYHLIKGFSSLVTLGNLKSFLLSPVLTILYLPFLYIMALFMAYESFLKSTKWILKENMDVFKYLKWQVLLRCNFSLEKLRKVSKKLHVYVSIKEPEIKADLIAILKNENPVDLYS